MHSFLTPLQTSGFIVISSCARLLLRLDNKMIMIKDRIPRNKHKGLKQNELVIKYGEKTKCIISYLT